MTSNRFATTEQGLAGGVLAGWRSVRLGDLFEQVVDTGHSADLPVLSVTLDRGVVHRASLDRRLEREVARHQYLLARPGDIAYNTMRMWQGGSGLVREEGYLSPAYTVCRARPGESPEFWALAFKSAAMIRAFRAHSQGFAKDRYRLYFHHFAAVPALRPPLPEQRKIYAILASIEETIEKARIVIANLHLVKSTLASQLLSRGLPARHHRFKQTGIGIIPECWEVAILETVASRDKYSCIGGPFGSDLTSKDYVGSGIPVLRGVNLSGTSHWVRESDFVYVDKEKAKQLARNLAAPGDIVFTQRGTLGQVARIQPTSRHKAFVVSQSQMKLTVDPGIMDPDFLVHFFRSRPGQTMMANAAVATGVPHINLQILKGFEVPLPSLSEQQQITHILGSANERIDAERAVLETLERFKSAFANALLTGHIRVTPDEAPS